MEGRGLCWGLRWTEAGEMKGAVSKGGGNG